eukprot:GILI01015320.1.p1 GENE.GILI01015320.1~~GILI01015320.1.p1  ORF type:complete len:142 (+),score=50.05 GILI01015320.1:35-427(+)
MAMLNAVVLPRVLEQALGGGVLSVMLVNAEGSLLSYVGDTDADRKAQVQKTVGAVIANIWTEYDDSGRTFVGANNLNHLFFDCDEGKLAVTRTSKVFLCIYADQTAEFGMLKLKLERLSSNLEGPFNQLF